MNDNRATKAAQTQSLVSSLIQRCPKKSSAQLQTDSVTNQLTGAHLGTPSNAAVVATERDTLVLDGDVSQVLVGLADVHAFNGLGCLTGVLFTQQEKSSD